MAVRTVDGKFVAIGRHVCRMVAGKRLTNAMRRIDLRFRLLSFD
jgi:hypothetical protein